MELAPRLTSYARPGGKLVLSGLLAEQVGGWCPPPPPPLLNSCHQRAVY